MNRNFQISKLFIIAILLAVFSGVYITDCLCNIEHSKLIASEQTHHYSKKNHHDKNTTENHHHDKNSKTDGCCSDEDNCCCENTNLSLLSDSPKIITSIFQYKFQTFNTPFFIHNLNIPKYEYLTLQFIAYQYKLPPPKIPDIRVFIQSFII